MALHEGHIAEMKTGEGKTLVSTLAGYLNAIAGKGVHVVTVNDYLAKRDSEWMGRIYKYLGMTVGLLQNNMPLELKRPAYQPTSRTAPTPSSVSITCAITWSPAPSSVCSAATTTPSSTRSTPS